MARLLLHYGKINMKAIHRFAAKCRLAMQARLSHSLMQRPHPRHASVSTKGLVSQCISFFQRQEAQQYRKDMIFIEYHVFSVQHHLRKVLISSVGLDYQAEAAKKLHIFRI